MKNVANHAITRDNLELCLKIFNPVSIEIKRVLCFSQLGSSDVVLKAFLLYHEYITISNTLFIKQGIGEKYCYIKIMNKTFFLYFFLILCPETNTHAKNYTLLYKIRKRSIMFDYCTHPFSS